MTLLICFWNLGIGVYLGFGAWDLEILGQWGLEIGIWDFSLGGLEHLGGHNES
jgi:hypothetical protein